MKTICLRLVDGTEVMGQTEQEIGENPLNLEEVYVINEIFTPEGFLSVSFYPFMSYSSEKLFTFNQRSIITITTPDKEIVEYYLKVIDKLKEMSSKEKTTKLSEEERNKIYTLFKDPTKKDG